MAGFKSKSLDFRMCAVRTGILDMAENVSDGSFQQGSVRTLKIHAVLYVCGFANCWL